MAKRFSDLGIKTPEEKTIFNCQQVSITDILNSEIEVIDFIRDMKTKHGEGRFLVHYRLLDGSAEGKFFTNAASLKAVLVQVKDEDLPFITVIRATKCGNGKIFQFT